MRLACSAQILKNLIVGILSGVIFFQVSER